MVGGFQWWFSGEWSSTVVSFVGGLASKILKLRLIKLGYFKTYLIFMGSKYFPKITSYDVRNSYV